MSSISKEVEISIAASILLILSLVISNLGEREMTNSEKQALLKEAKEMFKDVDTKNEVYNKIVENELVIVYTRHSK